MQMQDMEKGKLIQYYVKIDGSLIDTLHKDQIASNVVTYDKEEQTARG